MRRDNVEISDAMPGHATLGGLLAAMTAERQGTTDLLNADAAMQEMSQCGKRPQPDMAGCAGSASRGLETSRVALSPPKFG